MFRHSRSSHYLLVVSLLTLTLAPMATADMSHTNEPARGALMSTASPTAVPSQMTTGTWIEITEGNCEEEVFQSKLPVVVQCYKVNSLQCRLLSAVVAQCASRYAGKVKFLKLNMSARPRLAEIIFNVTNVPTLILTRPWEGSLLRATGIPALADLEHHLDDLVRN